MKGAKNKWVVVLLGLCCLLVLPAVAQKQESVLNILEKSRKAYQDIKTITGRLEIFLGSPEPGADMLVGQLAGDIRLKRVEADTSLGWYIADQFVLEDNPSMGYKVYYTGDSLIYFNLEDSTLSNESPRDAYSEWGFTTIHEWTNTIDLFYERLLLPDSVFEKKEDAWLIGQVSLGRDTVIAGRNCFVLENWKEDSRPELQVVFSNFEKLAIDKKNYFPVYHYKHFKRSVNGQPNIDQVNQTILSGLQLNKHIPDRDFQLQEKIRVKQPENVVQLVKGDQVPDWKLADINGDSLSLYQQKRKCILLEFSYVGCGACAMAAQEIQREVLDSCDREKFTFICINPVDSYGMIKKYAKEMKITYPMLKGSKELAGQYGITGYPQIFVLDSQYRIIRIISGYSPGVGKELREMIENSEEII